MVGTVRGVYLTRSSLNDNVTYTGGVFAGRGESFLMLGLNLTDFAKGQAAIDVGYYQGGLAKGKSIEFTYEFKPADALHDVFYPILAPLTDYQNFRDPFSER